MRRHGTFQPQTLGLIIKAYELTDRAKFAIMDLKSAIRKEYEFEQIAPGVLKPGLKKFSTAMVLVDIDSRFIKKLHRRVSKEIGDSNDMAFVLEEVAWRVGKKIKYNIRMHEKTLEFGYVSAPIGYFGRHGGVCRHQAAGVLGVLQKLRERKRIDGTIILVHGFREGMTAGHAWVEMFSEGTRFVIDPTRMMATSNPELIGQFYDKEFPNKIMLA